MVSLVARRMSPVKDTKRAFVETLLTDGQDTPDEIDHSTDPAFVSPRQQIRGYLGTLCDAIGEGLPPSWPDVSTSTYQQIHSRLRRSSEQLYAYAERANAGATKRARRDQRIALRLLGERTRG